MFTTLINTTRLRVFDCFSSSSYIGKVLTPDAPVCVFYRHLDYFRFVYMPLFKILRF